VGTSPDAATIIVEPGPITAAEQAEANRLWSAAQRSFEARRLFEVLRTVEDLLTRFPASDVSGEALRVSALANAEVGNVAEADVAAERYAALLETGDPRGAEMRLLQGAVLASDPEASLERLLRMDDGASAGQVREGTALVREASDSLPVAAMQAAVDSAITRGPLAPVAEARLAVSLLEVGRGPEAEAYATRAVTAGVVGEELAWAQGVLLGELPEGRGRVTTFTIGVVLPIGGPPALAEFSSLIAEGVELAAATVLGDDFTVTVDIRDDEGDPLLAAELVSQLESEGVVGVVGMLEDDVLVQAGQARARAVPLVSPTARSARRSGDAVYSLEGADPEAAAALARYAASRAFQRIAIVHPQTPEAEAEADAFEATAASLGIPVVGRFAYQAGATFFEPEIIGARDALRGDELARLMLTEDDTLHMEMLEPAALFMPIPPEDVEFLAPQVVHFGLDTLAIEILGTSGWTDPQILSVVEPRLTDGVVATAPTGTGLDAPGRIRFQQAYEEYFQRSLVGGTSAVGYDAMLLLLESLRAGRVDPLELRAGFERLAGVEGATGVFSVVDGTVVRSTVLVRIQGQVAVPIELLEGVGEVGPNGSENR
jgi:ABC-type branched-subunit amino acid transport system substrate-binding protein